MSNSVSMGNNHPIGSRESADDLFREIDSGMIELESSAARLADAASERLKQMKESQNGKN